MVISTQLPSENLIEFCKLFNLRYNLEPRFSYSFYSILPLGKHDEDTYLKKSGICILAAGLMHSFHYPKIVLVCRDVPPSSKKASRMWKEKRKSKNYYQYGQWVLNRGELSELI